MEKEKIKSKLDFYKEQIKEITTDVNQFQINIESNFWVLRLEHILNTIKKHESYIGKEVYPYLNSFDYTDDFKEDIFRKLGEKFIYTEDLHDKFLLNYKVKVIELLYTSDNLNIDNLFKLPSLIENCIDLWMFKQRREIINFLKEL